MPLYVRAGFDLSDGSYVLDVVETGGSTFTVTLSSGTHFVGLSAASASGDHASLVTGYTDLLAAIEAALDAGGTAGYSVTLDESTQRVTIAHDGSGGVTAIALTPTTRGYYIGHTTVQSGALSHEMDVAPYYWIAGTIGFWSRYAEYEDRDGAAYDVIAHSARPHGIARSVVAKHLDLTVPLEPLAVVYAHEAATATPWTWEHLFRHARNVLPLAIDDGTHIHYVRLREDGAVFAPKPIAADYVGHWDIPLKMRLLAREDS